MRKNMKANPHHSTTDAEAPQHKTRPNNKVNSSLEEPIVALQMQKPTPLYTYVYIYIYAYI